MERAASPPAWYSSTASRWMSNVTNGQSYNLELYVLDYDAKGRSEQIQFSKRPRVRC